MSHAGSRSKEFSVGAWTSAAASSLTSLTPVTPTGDLWAGDLNPAPLMGGVLGEGGCRRAGEVVGGTSSSARVSLQSLPPKPMSSWPSTCSCEKLEQLLVRLGTTLINRVDEGPKEGGGGTGEGMGVGVVGAEQRAALREA